MLVDNVPSTGSPAPTDSIGWNARSTLLNLPNEILRIILDNLDLPDRASFALTCKPVAIKLEFWRLLRWDTVGMSSLKKHQDPLADLLKGRLGKDWFPAHLKYCCKCGKYLPRCRGYWKRKLHTEFFLKSGNVAQKYRRWIHNRSGGLVGTASTTLEEECLHWSRAKPQTCPRCKLMA